MKATSENRLERLLRQARQNVLSSDDWTAELASRRIAIIKRLLMPVWDKRAADIRLVESDKALRAMWM